MPRNVPFFVSPFRSFGLENIAAGRPIYRAHAIDPSGVQYSLASGVGDNDLFAVDPLTGLVSFKQSPDFEYPLDFDHNNIYNISVTATDASGQAASRGVFIQVGNRPEPLNQFTTGFSASTPENVDTSTVVYTAHAVRGHFYAPHARMQYSLAPNVGDNDLFNIDPVTGNVTFKAPPDYEHPLDAGHDNVYNIVVTASTGFHRFDGTRAVAITVTNLDDNRPVFTSGDYAAELENTPASNVVYTAHATTAEAGAGPITYSLGSGADSASFNIDPVTGALTFKAPPDYEHPQDYDHNNIYNVGIIASDGTQTSIQSIGVYVSDVNDNAPIITSGGSASTPENVSTSTAVYTAQATDADGTSYYSTVHYSLGGGADQALFNIDANTGAVTFKASPDYEHPSDGGGNNVYDIVVTATDVGGLAASKAVAITIKDVNDNAPVITSGTTGSEAENTAVSNVVYTAHASDADGTSPNNTVTYTLSGADAGQFNINATSGAVTFKASPDYEAPSDADHDNVYAINVVATDGGNPALSSSKAVTITVTDLNDNAPVFTSTATPNVPENSVQVVTLTTTDADTVGSNPPTFAITGGADEAQFQIVGGNQLQFVAAKDYETQPHSYQVQVTASDGANTSVQNLTVALTDLPPSITSGNTASVNEGVAAGTQVYTAVAADPAGGTVNYALTGTDAGAFTIDSSTGAVTINATPDYETKTSYSFNVQASDPSNHLSTQAVTLTVNDLPPSITSGDTASVNEGVAAGTQVYSAVAADPAGGTVSYALTGTDAGAFTINSSTGAVTINAAPDYETKTSYSFNVVASDPSNHFSTQAVTLTVNDLPPSITSGNTASVNEGVAAGTQVYAAVAADPAGGTVSYALTGTDAGAFTIDSSTGAVTINATPDYETKTSYSFNVVASDPSNHFSTQAVTLTVNDLPPSITSGNTASVNEGVAAGTQVYAAVAADPAGGTVSYALTGTDAGAFTIDSSTGAVTINATPDYETKTSYSFTVQASDPSGMSSTKPVTLSVNDLNDNTPVITSGDAASTPENVTTAVYTATATDGDGASPNNTVHYSLSGTDAGLFNIDATSGAVTFKASPDYEHPADNGGNNIYNITVVATDGGSPALSSSKAVAISVTDANDNAPVITSVDAATTPENVSTTTPVYTATATDADGTSPNNNVHYSLSGADADQFNIDATSGAVTFKASPDYEHPTAASGNNVYDFNVVATDGGTPALSSSKAVAIAVGNVNEAPTAFVHKVADNEDTPASITLDGSDPDAGDRIASFTISNLLSLSGGTLYTDAAHTTAVVEGQTYATAPDGTLTLYFQPAPNYYSSNVSFQATPNDTHGLAGNVTGEGFNIASVNDAPVGTDKTISGNGQHVFTAADFGFTDPNDAAGPGGANNFQAVKITTLPTSGSLTDNGNAVHAGDLVSVTDINGSHLVFTPTPNTAATFTFQVQDDGGQTNGGVNLDTTARTFTLNPDAPPVVTASHTLAYNENDPATAFDPAIAVSDSDSSNLDHVTVQITGNYVSGEDHLGFTDTATITGAFDAGTGTLTLSGTDSVADYQDALRTVTYQNTSDNPSGAARTVTVIANDGIVDGAPATDTINVTPINDAPTATNLSRMLTIDEDAAATNLFTTAPTVSDVDSATVTATLTMAAAAGVLTGAGTATMSGGNLVYTITDTPANVSTALAAVKYDSADNYNGSTSVSVAIDDGHNGPQGMNPSGTVSISVTAVNDAPTATNLSQMLTIDEDAAAANLFGTAPTVSDVDSPTVTATLTLADPNAGVLTGATAAATPGVYTITGSPAAVQTALAAVKFDSADNYNGTTSVAVAISDGAIEGPQGTNPTGTVAITVNAVNDAPTLAATGGTHSYSAGVDLFSNVTATTGPADEAGQLLDRLVLTVTNVSGTSAESLTVDGVSVALTDGTNITPPTGLGVTTMVTVANGTATVTITKSGGITAAQMGALVDGLAYTDTNVMQGDPSRVSTLTSLRDTGGIDHNGTDTATLHVQSTVTFNAPPTANDDATSATEKGGSNNTAGGSDPTGNVITGAGGHNEAADTDDQGTANLTVVSYGTGAEGDPDNSGVFGMQLTSANGYGTLTLSSTGVYTYTVTQANAAVQALNIGGTLEDYFHYTIQDGGGLQDTATITVTINGANDAASISGTTSGSVIEAGAANAGGTPTATGILTDADVDNTPNTFTAVSTATASTNGYGTYTMTSGGTWTYTLDNTNTTVNALKSGQTTSDTFTVTTVDGTSQVVTVTINGANDAPTATNHSITTSEDTATSGLGATLLMNDTDPEGDTLTISAVGTASHGTVSLNGGNPIYTPASNYSGQDSFNYTISDGNGGTSSATVHVDVSPVADAPTVANYDLTPVAFSTQADSTPASGIQENDSRVARISGGYIVTYTATNNNTFTSEIDAQRFDNTGAALGTVRLTTSLNSGSTIEDLQPDVRSLPNGGFLLTFVRYDFNGANDYDVYGETFNSSGTATSSAFLISTTSLTQTQEVPVSAVFSGNSTFADGSFVTVYAQTTTPTNVGTSDIYARISNADGTANTSVNGGNPFLVNTTTTQEQRFPQVVMLSDHGFLVVWQTDTDTSSAVNYDIHAQRYNASGATVGNEFQINTTPTFNQDHPAVTALANGGWVVTWASSLAAGNDTQIYARMFNSSGVGGAEITVGAAGGYDVSTPSIIALPDGGFLVSWETETTATAGNIHAQRFDAAGATVGSEYVVAASGGSSHTESAEAMALLSTGKVASTWFDNGSSITSVHSEVYTLPGDGQQNSTITLSKLTATVNDHDGSESISYHLTGFNTATTTFNYGSLVNGEWVISDPADVAALQNTALTATVTAPGTFTLTIDTRVTDTATLSDNMQHTSTSDVTKTIVVGVKAPADPVFAAHDAGPFDLHLSAVAATDTVQVDTLPDNGHITYADGTLVKADVILSAHDLAGLKFAPSDSATDHSATFTYSVSDGTAVTTQTLPITVLHGSNLTITGTADKDVLVGGAGNDTLNGSGGGNYLTGGGGGNTFVFDAKALVDATSTAHLVDHVTDYNAAHGDTFDFSALFSATATATTEPSSIVHAIEDASGTFATIAINTDAPAHTEPHWVEIAQLDGIHAGDTINLILSSNNPSHISHIHVDGIA